MDSTNCEEEEDARRLMEINMNNMDLEWNENCHECSKKNNENTFGCDELKNILKCKGDGRCQFVDKCLRKVFL